MLSAKRIAFFWFLVDNVAIRCSYFFKCFSFVKIVADSITVEIRVFVACKYVFVEFWFCYRFRIFLSWPAFFPLSHFLFIKTKFVISTACIAWYSRRHYPLDTMFHNSFHNLFQLSISHYLWLQTFS